MFVKENPDRKKIDAEFMKLSTCSAHHSHSLFMTQK